MEWVQEIRVARERAEDRYGFIASHLILRQEIWLEFVAEFSSIDFEFDGMVVSVSDNILNPYEFAVNIEELESEK